MSLYDICKGQNTQKLQVTFQNTPMSLNMLGLSCPFMGADSLETKKYLQNHDPTSSQEANLAYHDFYFTSYFVQKAKGHPAFVYDSITRK